MLAAVVLALVALVLVVYTPSLRNDFADWDDYQNVLANPHLNPVTAAGVARFWTTPYYELYTPVTYTVWAACAALARSDTPLPRPSGGTVLLHAPVFHAASLLLHLANTLLVFVLLRRLLARLAPRGPGENRPTPRDLAAAFGAALFAVHPLQVEAVVWVTGMNNLIAAFFALLSLHAYLTGAEREGWRPKLAATVLFALALLSKPTAAGLPLAAALMDIAVLRRPWRRSLPLVVVWAGLALGCAVLTRATSGGGVPGAITLPLWQRPFVVGDALAFYLRKLAAPVNLCPDYGRRPAVLFGSPWAYLAWVVPVGFAGAAWRLRGRSVLIGLGLFVALALPMLGLVPFYFHAFSTVADRYVYLALLGPGLAAAWGVERALSRGGAVRRATLAAGAVLVGLWALLSVRQGGFWHDTFALSAHTLRVNPSSATSYNNIGVARNRQGRSEEALEAFQKAATLPPPQASVLYNLAYALIDQGRPGEARPPLEEALRLQPDYLSAYSLLGMAWEHEGRLGEAIRAYREALRVRPDDRTSRGRLDAALRLEAAGAPPDEVRVRANLAWGASLARRGEREGARAAFDRALAERPGNAEIYYLKGTHLSRAGDTEGALAALHQAARLRPGWAEPQQAIRELESAARPVADSP